MPRILIPALAMLLFSASPAFADSQKVTEQSVSFDQAVEAPALTTGTVAEASQPATEQAVSFAAPAEAAPFAGSLAASPSRQVTEQIASLEAPVQGAQFAASGAAGPAVAARSGHVHAVASSAAPVEHEGMACSCPCPHK